MVDRNLSAFGFIESVVDDIDNAAVALNWLLTRDNGGETFQVEVIAEMISLAIHTKASNASEALTRLRNSISAEAEVRNHA
jgi:hypothetical protein